MTILSTSLSAQALLERANELQKQGRHTEAVQYFDAAIEKAPEYFKVISERRFSSAWAGFKHAQDQSEWQHYEHLQRLTVMGVAQDVWFVGEATLAAPALSNLALLYFTQKHAEYIQQSLQDQILTAFKHVPPSSSKKIKLGFVGADFFAQATAYLLTGAVAKIDRTQFEVCAYDFGDTPSQNDGYRRRVENAYDAIIPIQELTDEQAAQRMYEDGIDILLSIKNPASARLGIFARRPAPIQIHYLYFPGTSGMPFFDYIIGDAIVTPPELDYAYAEKVLRIEGCYQPNDELRGLPEQLPRSHWGLPEDAFVLANMSQNYKITPQIFDVWCHLLRLDASRVLWLLSDNEEVCHNLRVEASRRGIHPSRLYFSPPLGIGAHFARLRCADVIVDTHPYNGHTLTSDALWAGTPVVTWAGTTFASRVAASLLHAVGLDECVTWHEDEYFKKIDELARNVSKLKAMRQHLDNNRYQFDVFNAQSYAHRFGALMKRVIHEHWSGTHRDDGVRNL
ncbi:UDP-N-acetylglucosamine-peptide N-acetylglucosaminyltransferase [Hydromonas duriensis]|uniref:protein O-GlcNAc transferase n=1 Tax=Hydromonas duriensis TaxID=1527608 RepID=A0A4R6Y751_9BURK|nr:UDP-N-acetylglucosamine-peptide N-acetylglucosaminyltransferase [Hydromonas duriensis]TDR30972.1 putative O-linked N-acetylglucosamine transferase (SPINDLY family) [Hydromonas duriensis]